MVLALEYKIGCSVDYKREADSCQGELLDVKRISQWIIVLSPYGQAGQSPACPSCRINYPIHRLIMIVNDTAYIEQSPCLKVIQTFHELSRFL